MREAWKTFERRVAKAFNTVRTPLSGSNSHHTHSDSLHESLFIEAKRAARYKAVITLWKSTRELARKEKKVPMLALGDSSFDGFLVVVHVKHVKDVYEALAEEFK